MRSQRLAGAACALAIGACFATADVARAQTALSRIQAFGDSYVDNGNAFRLAGVSFPAAYPTGRFSGGTNYIDTISQLLNIPQLNYAIGGAETGTLNVSAGLPGFAQEWASFVAAGNRIASTDLVALNIGGNDARAYWLGGGSIAGAPAAATVAATQAMAGINALTGAGMRNLVFTVGDVSTLPEAIGVPAAAAGSAFSQSYNAQMQTALAATARNGVRVEWVDIALIGQQINRNPAAYGISNTGACPLTCIGNPALQNQYLFYFDKVHLTSHGFAILGEYIVNRLEAPLTIAPQGDVSMISAMGFSNTLFGRLDNFRELSGTMATAMNSYNQMSGPRYTKAPPLAPVAAASPWSVYILANGGVSDRSSNVASNAVDLTSVGGTIGTEYRIAGNALIGAAFDYSNPIANFNNNGGRINADSYQFGLYGEWTDAHFFAQGLATLGWQKFHNNRVGVIDNVSFDPDGTTFVAGGKAGYLFDAGKVRLGPIAGLLYARAKVNGYTETGDPVLTLNVGDQVEEALVGSAGAQFRFPFAFNGRIVSPYLNLTAEDDFIGDGRIIQYGATSAPLIINNWAVPDSGNRVYGRVAGGFVAPVSDTLAFTANASTTFARQGGNDFYGNGGLKISF